MYFTLQLFLLKINIFKFYYYKVMKMKLHVVLIKYMYTINWPVA